MKYINERAWGNETKWVAPSNGVTPDFSGKQGY